MATVAPTMTGPILVEGVPLKQRLARAERRKRVTALLMVSPLLLFIVVSFVIPIGDMLFRSVDNPRLSILMPETTKALEAWHPAQSELPDEAVFATAFKEILALRESGDLGKVASRLNYDMSGARSLVTKSGRKFKRIKEGPYKAKMIKADKRWGKQRTWSTIKVASNPTTAAYYLASIDMRYDENLEISNQPESRQIYVTLFLRTLKISGLVLLICVLMGYPIAYLMATLPTRTSNLLLIMVLLPFWTSLLVRTTSWIVLLQTEGVLNDILVWVGIIGDESRIQMIYNETGTLIAMSQILLPFMVLPLFSVMKTIPLSQLRASQSLGANPVLTFFKIFLPQSVPGIGAGGLLVFVLAVGYYITPALVGGPTGQLISNMIAFHMKSSLNWGLAAALGTLLLAGVLILYWFYNRLVGIDRMRLG
ncbi:MAG: ABC transporter permease [Pseudomonadota bacterium]